MIDTKNLFLDTELKSGGFYELSIQVCPSIYNDPIKRYTDLIWKQENVEGPFDLDFNPILPDIQNIEHKGILHLDNFSIPFMTYNIREDEPIETGFNWFDICFYTTAIEKIFGSEFQTWTENPKEPKQLDDFFKKSIKALYRQYPFDLAIIGFEVSGSYYLKDLKKNLSGGWTPARFFVGKDNFEFITDSNKKFVTQVDKIDD